VASVPVVSGPFDPHGPKTGKAFGNHGLSFVSPQGEEFAKDDALMGPALGAGKIPAVLGSGWEQHRPEGPRRTGHIDRPLADAT
jgi:hypothetical protein